MRSQATIFLLLSLLVGAYSSATCTGARADSDPLLGRVGFVFPRTTIQGTMSLEGQMTISNLPFVAHLHNDTIAVTVSAPFGMTAGTMLVTADTFVVVNYLSREVLLGHPEAPSVAAASPIPLNLGDIRAFMRGSIPGDLSRFQRGSQRSDGKVLFVARDTLSTEFALIDSLSTSIAQYQRKNRQGKTLVNMVLGDIRDVAAQRVPYAIDVDVDDKAQAVKFRFESVEPHHDSPTLAAPELPPSFTRRIYAR